MYLHVLLNAFIHTVMYTYYFVSMHTKVRVPPLSRYVPFGAPRLPPLLGPA